MPDRSAPFVAVLALAWPDGGVALYRGEVAGRLSGPPAATRASATILSSCQRLRATFGEIEPAAKHRISHRARAFAKLVDACFVDR